jgi:hypothetical protein
MTVNFPGPYELRIIYTCNATPGGILTHQHRLNVDVDGTPDVGEDFANIDIVTRADGNHILSVVVENYVALLAPFFNSTATTFTIAELWKYEAGTFNADYVSTYEIDEPGTSASSLQKASEAIFTFRTLEGGIMKLVLLDGVFAPDVPKVYADMGSDAQDLVDYVVDAVSARFLGRDTSYPAVFLRLFNGQNENVFKRRYRG